MQDILIPYMCDPRHLPDTLFIVLEEDFRVYKADCTLDWAKQLEKEWRRRLITGHIHEQFREGTSDVIEEWLENRLLQQHHHEAESEQPAAAAAGGSGASQGESASAGTRTGGSGAAQEASASSGDQLPVELDATEQDATLVLG